MSTKHYLKISEALEAGKVAYSNQYGVYPRFYVYRDQNGYTHSKSDKRTQRKVRIVEEVPNYFLEALKAVMGKTPPMAVPPYEALPMGNAMVQLQDWCATYANPPWATGLSMIEAAELIVSQALDNCNIKRT